MLDSEEERKGNLELMAAEHRRKVNGLAFQLGRLRSKCPSADISNTMHEVEQVPKGFDVQECPSKEQEYGFAEDSQLRVSVKLQCSGQAKTRKTHDATWPPGHEDMWSKEARHRAAWMT